MPSPARERTQPAATRPTRYTVEEGLADQLSLLVEHRLDAKVDGWKQSLAEGIVTDEMRQVFFSIGWLPSLADKRLRPVDAPRGAAPASRKAAPEALPAAAEPPQVAEE